MKKRLFRLFIRYIPGTSKLASLEASRIAKYLCDNYNIHQQLIVYEEIKQNLIIRREKQIQEEEIIIENKKKYLQKLKNNLINLNT